MALMASVSTPGSRPSMPPGAVAQRKLFQPCGPSLHLLKKRLQHQICAFATCESRYTAKQWHTLRYILPLVADLDSLLWCWGGSWQCFLRVAFLRWFRPTAADKGCDVGGLGAKYSSSSLIVGSSMTREPFTTLPTCARQWDCSNHQEALRICQSSLAVGCYY